MRHMDELDGEMLPAVDTLAQPGEGFKIFFGMGSQVGDQESEDQIPTFKLGRNKVMNGKMLRTVLRVSTMATMCLVLNGCSGCNSGVQGKYQDESHIMTIELLAGGKASVAFGAIATPATYTVEGNKITIDVAGEKQAFMLNSDGSLSAPAGSPLGKLTRVK
jgi:hypothetical protein